MEQGEKDQRVLKITGWTLMLEEGIVRNRIVEHTMSHPVLLIQKKKKKNNNKKKKKKKKGKKKIILGFGLIY